MRSEIIITPEEFTDICVTVYKVLVEKGTISRENMGIFLEITTAMGFMFTEEYQQIKEKKNG